MTSALGWGTIDTMTGMHVELEQLGAWRWHLVVVRDGWVVEEREFRGPRWRAKRITRDTFVAQRHRPPPPDTSGEIVDLRPRPPARPAVEAEGRASDPVESGQVTDGR